MNFLITNREIITQNRKETLREDGKEYAGDNIRFGEYDLGSKAFTLYQEPETLTDLAYDNLPESEAKLKGSHKFFRKLHHEIMQAKVQNPQKADVLFFVHGFKTNVEGVKDAYKDLHEKYVLPAESPIAHIVMFSFPSQSPWGTVPVPFYTYYDDKKDAIRSGEALARVFEKLKRFFTFFFIERDGYKKNKLCGQQIHLMVHSMGNQVVGAMMEKINAQTTEIFGEIILVAADIDYNAFEKEGAYNRLIDMGKRIHIYHSRQDHILDFSKFTKNLNNRLGKYGRNHIDNALHDVHDIDVSRCDDDAQYQKLVNKFGGHWYYYTSSEVANDIINVLKGEKSNILPKSN